MPPSRNPLTVGSIDLMRIEDFPASGEPEGARYILIISRDGAGCFGYRNGGKWYSDAGDPVTPIYWGRILAVS